MITMVCLTDRILAREIPSREWARGRIEHAKSGIVVDTSINDEEPEDNLIGARFGGVLYDEIWGNIRFLACKFRRILLQIFV